MPSKISFEDPTAEDIQSIDAHQVSTELLYPFQATQFDEVTRLREEVKRLSKLLDTPAESDVPPYPTYAEVTFTTYIKVIESHLKV